MTMIDEPTNWEKFKAGLWPTTKECALDTAVPFCIFGSAMILAGLILSLLPNNLISDYPDELTPDISIKWLPFVGLSIGYAMSAVKSAIVREGERVLRREKLYKEVGDSIRESKRNEN